MKLFSEDIELLKEIQINGEIEIYYLHEKYKLSPAQVARSIRKLEDNKIIKQKKTSIILTENGKQWLFKNRRSIYLKEKKKYWKVIPEEMIGEKIEINELFSPKRNKIDNDIYKLNEGG